MSVKKIIIIIIVVIILGAGWVSSAFLQRRIEHLERENEDQREVIENVQRERDQLRSANERLNAAFAAFQAKAEEAHSENEKREILIKNFEDSKNWRSDPLPCSVSRMLWEAANDLCQSSTSGTSEALRGSGSRGDENK